MGRLRTAGAATALALVATLAQPAQADELPTEAIVERALAHVPELPAPATGERTRIEGATATVREGGAGVTVAPEDQGDSVAVDKPDGAQVLTVLQRGEDEARFKLEMDDVQLVEAGKGYVLRDGPLVLGSIAAPWAVDANGKHLYTSYRLDGDTLVQSVDTTGAAFPVVADPRLSFGWGVYLNLTGAEVKGFTAAILAAGGASAVATCTIGRIPPAIRNLVKLLCNDGLTPSTIAGVATVIVNYWRNARISTGGCYQMRLIPRFGGMYPVRWKGNCIP